MRDTLIILSFAVIAVSVCVSLAYNDQQRQAEYYKHTGVLRREYIKHKFCQRCGDCRWMNDNKPCPVCNPRGTREVGER